MIEIWKAGLLSGPETHLVNLVSNSLALPWQMMVRTLAAGIGRVMHPNDGVRLGEALAMAGGTRQSLREAWLALGRSLMSGQQEFGQGQTEAPMVPRTSAEALNLRLFGRTLVPPQAWRERGPSGDLNRLGALLQGSTWRQMAQQPETVLGLGLDLFSMAWTLPFRALGASDSFFKVLNNGAELSAQALRQTEEEAARGTLAPDRVRTRYRELVDNPTEAMRIAARDFAEYNTFTKAPGPITQMFERMRQWNNPVARAAAHVLFPFTRTPGNLLGYAFLEHTPLALLTAKFRTDVAAGGARADLALAKMGLGTILLTVALDLALDGHITGGGPDDPEKRDLWMRSGWRPFSVRIPDGTNADGTPRYTFVPINRVDPIASIPLLGAELAEILQGQDMRYTDEVQRAWTAAVFAVTEIAMSKPTLQGFNNIARALTNSERYGFSFVRNTAASAVPALANFIAIQKDPVMRQAADIMAALKRRIPGLSSELPPRFDFWGREVGRPTSMGVTWNTSFPLGISTTEGAQPIDRELVRLNYYPAHPRTLSVMRSEAAKLALESLPANRRRGLDALIAAAENAPVRGESNSVPLRGMPHVQNRLISLTSATPASQLIRDNEDYLIAARRRDAVRQLEQYGDKTLLQTLNELVTNNPDYRQSRDDQRLQAIQDIIGHYRAAARAQAVREFPELQERRDRTPTRSERAMRSPF